MAVNEITSPDEILKMVNAFRVSRIILTADELGVFDHMQGKGVTSKSVADDLHTSPRATDRLLNALVTLGLITKQEGLFKNTGFSGRFLVKSSPSYLGSLGLANQTWKTWSTLSEAVRMGTTVVMEHSINERTEEWRGSFISAMHARAADQAPEVAGTLDITNCRKILDVGGGSGAFAYAMIRENPQIHAVIFDLPNIIPMTRGYIENSGLASQVTTVTGDYLADSLGNGYDLVLMSAIIHINSPAENQLLIRKGAEALNSGGQLVILDHIMSEDRTEPQTGAVFALNMLVGTFHGDTYTRNEIRSWMLHAGLNEIELKLTPSGIQLMIGKKY